MQNAGREALERRPLCKRASLNVPANSFEITSTVAAQLRRKNKITEFSGAIHRIVLLASLLCTGCGHVLGKYSELMENPNGFIAGTSLMCGGIGTVLPGLALCTILLPITIPTGIYLDAAADHATGGLNTLYAMYYPAWFSGAAFAVAAGSCARYCLGDNPMPDVHEKTAPEAKFTPMPDQQETRWDEDLKEE